MVAPAPAVYIIKVLKLVVQKPCHTGSTVNIGLLAGANAHKVAGATLVKLFHESCENCENTGKEFVKGKVIHHGVLVGVPVPTVELKILIIPRSIILIEIPVGFPSG
jgi:hypothetical protein